MIGYYNYSVILTYFGLISSILGMSYLHGDNKYGIIVSLILFMVSGVCDMFDGAIASKCKRTNEAKLFGIQIDSLCDLVCFGVFPGMITVTIAQTSLFSKIAFALIVLASVIRLAYFNVQESIRDRSEKLKTYQGLPVTVTSIAYPFMVIVGSLLGFKLSIFMPIVLIFEAALEVSKLPIKKPYGKEKLALIVLGIAVFVGVIALKDSILSAMV